MGNSYTFDFRKRLYVINLCEFWWPVSGRSGATCTGKQYGPIKKPFFTLSLLSLFSTLLDFVLPSNNLCRLCP